MRSSESRIITTHAGSLPRPRELVDLQVRRHRGDPVDAAALQDAVVRATQQAVAHQLAAGVDVGNDGEQARESFFTYVKYRMSGFGGESRRPRAQDVERYPSFLSLYETHARKSLHTSPPRAIGDVRYLDRHALAQ